MFVVQTSLSGALDTIAAAAKELVSAQHVAVLLMDHPRQVLWTSIVDSNDISKRPISLRVRRGQGIIACCAADKQQVALCTQVWV